MGGDLYLLLIPLSCFANAHFFYLMSILDLDNVE